MSIVDGREQLLEECRASSPDVQDYLAHEISTLLAAPAFVEALSGHLPADAASQQRLPQLRQKLQQIASLRPI